MHGVGVALVRETPSRHRGLRIGLAFVLALAADGLFLAVELVPPLAIAIDAGVATALFFLLGARWSLVPVLAVEIFPLTAVFPTWTLAVTALAVSGRSPQARRS